MWSLKTGGLWRQVLLHWNVGVLYTRNIWSFNTGGLSWQWSLKTGFTVYSNTLTAIIMESVNVKGPVFKILLMSVILINTIQCTVHSSSVISLFHSHGRAVYTGTLWWGEETSQHCLWAHHKPSTHATWCEYIVQCTSIYISMSIPVNSSLSIVQWK